MYKTNFKLYNSFSVSLENISPYQQSIKNACIPYAFKHGDVINVLKPSLSFHLLPLLATNQHPRHRQQPLLYQSHHARARNRDY